ncbi:hypothetical protein DY000_02029040 [Brassica cretica]|uniref:No apical meristem-associated C-terminal domain-containing protein n=1 Tax=Brassica cretica TaxID=69181 RepID=A0ABQ7DS28_BRACR|nr:hypothetical protein DY000_02029040 [Brassica cretica]
MTSLLDNLSKLPESPDKKDQQPLSSQQPSSSRQITKINHYSDTSSSDYESESNDESPPKQFAIGEGSSTPKKKPDINEGRDVMRLPEEFSRILTSRILVGDLFLRFSRNSLERSSGTDARSPRSDRASAWTRSLASAWARSLRSYRAERTLGRYVATELWLELGRYVATELGSSSVATGVSDEGTTRPMGVKAAKARGKKPMGDAKDMSQFQTMWTIKQQDLAPKENISKMRLLDTLIAKQDPLADYEEALKKKLINELMSN